MSWKTATRTAVRELADARNVDVDDKAFAFDWRRRMFETLAEVRSGNLPWQNADELHRTVLDELAEPGGFGDGSSFDVIAEDYHDLARQLCN